MNENKPEMVDAPEPYHLIIPQSLYKAIKFNQGSAKSDEQIAPEDANEFDNFKKLFKEFTHKLNKQDPSAFSLLSSIMGMWGYSRKYCGMCGRPIIGKPEHIQNRMCCNTCGDSYKITEELLRQEKTEPVTESQAPLEPVKLPIKRVYDPQ